MTKHAQEFLENFSQPKIEKEKYIQSASRPWISYKVVKQDGVWICLGCDGFKYRGKCRHADQAMEEEKNETKRNKI